jgi:uncharacterized protein YceK
MKKLILLVCAVILLTSCGPVIEDSTSSTNTVCVTQYSGGVVIKQYNTEQNHVLYGDGYLTISDTPLRAVLLGTINMTQGRCDQ